MNTKTQRGHTNMNLKHLSDVHTRRYAQWVEDNLNWCTVRKERHIFFWQDTGNDTLVTVTSSHFVTFRYLTFLSDVNTNQLIHTWWQFITVFTGEHLNVNDNTITTMRNA